MYTSVGSEHIEENISAFKNVYFYDVYLEKKNVITDLMFTKVPRPEGELLPCLSFKLDYIIKIQNNVCVSLVGLGVLLSAWPSMLQFNGEQETLVSPELRCTAEHLS